MTATPITRYVTKIILVRVKDFTFFQTLFLMRSLKSYYPLKDKAHYCRKTILDALW